MTGPGVTWSVSGGPISLRGGALVGVVNVTPDSFSDGGEYLAPDVAIARGLEMMTQGAALVDVGGESTRPGARPVPEAEELRRLIPVVGGLVTAGVPVSVDTYKPGVAREGLAAGAVAINDVTGFRDPEMIEVVATSDCGVVVMHMQGTPVDMHIEPRYEDVVAEVTGFLLDRVAALRVSGVDERRIVIDPGLGFGKRAHHSLTLLANLDRLVAHGLPVMVGVSRKGFLGSLVANDTREHRDRAGTIANALAYARGARLFRVHDVALSKDALGVAAAIVTNQ
ncbi:MAG TPA: dihydropteroate synthase [Acidimicrobiia bacterium]|jgi:dihydropteroate synthase|nr:dihydropteroate synthase [Acidimicrobiia bacterium]